MEILHEVTESTVATVSQTNRADDGVVALTFDDGPSENTTQLLDILAREGVIATFFLIGENVARHPELVRAIAEGGHAVENHTWSHPHLPTLHGTEIAREIEKADEVICAAGVPRPQFIRPPFGEFDRSVATAVRSQHKQAVMWSVDSEDWTLQHHDRTIERALALQTGGILLLHDFVSETIEAVPAIIAGLRNQGFSFATVPHLMRSTPSTKPGSFIYSARDVRDVASEH